MRAGPLVLPLLLPAATGVLGKHHGASVVSSFRWQRPFPYDGSEPMGVDVQCRASDIFQASQYKLRDLQSPSPWSWRVLDLLGRHPYPGSWDGIDEGGDDRDIIIMEYKNVPAPVREWVEQQERLKEEKGGRSKWWMYAVFDKPTSLRSGGGSSAAAGGGDEGVIPDEDKVLMFAPAALYETLPLWVAKGSHCEAEMSDITKYSSYPRDKTVIAWPVEHTTQPGRDKAQDLTFKIQAYYVLETDHGKAWREMWEKMQAQERRQDRKDQRQKRQAARQQVRPKDEL